MGFISCVQGFVNEIETIELSLKNMKEIEANLRSCPVAGVKTWVQTRLVDYQTQLERFSKEVSLSTVLSEVSKRWRQWLLLITKLIL
jgi:hypothetical protein